METITQKYNKYIKDFLPKKQEDTEPLSLSSVTFTPPPSNILLYFNSLKSSEQKRPVSDTLNSTLTFDALPDEIKYTIEEEYHNELLSFDTTLKRLDLSLVKPYYKKSLTAEELFISVEISKAEQKKEDVEKARIKAEMTWDSLSIEKIKYWNKLSRICGEYWSSTFPDTFYQNFINYFSNRRKTSPLGTVTKDLLEKIKESYYHTKLSQLKTFGAWLISNELYFPKKADMFYYTIWRCDYIIEQILGEKPLRLITPKQVNKNDKDDFNKFLLQVRLTEQYVNYMVKNEKSYEMRQKYTPFYIFYLEKKEKISSKEFSIDEKVTYLDTEWSKLKEEEKRKYTLKVYDKLYNSTIILYDDDIEISNNASVIKKKSKMVKQNKTNCEESDDDEEDEDDLMTETESNSDSEEDSEIKKKRKNKQKMIQYIKDNYKTAKTENSNLTKNELISLLIFRFKNLYEEQSIKKTKNEKTKETRNKKKSVSPHSN